MLRLSAILLVLCPALPSQTSDYGSFRHEFSQRTSIGFGWGHVFGFAQDRRLLSTALRYGFRWRVIKRATLRYTTEVVPVAFLSEPYVDGVPTLITPVPSQTHREYVYGVGASPIGLQMNFRSGRRFQPVLDSNGGFLYFSRRVLSPEASQFNFTVHVGLGLAVFTDPRHAISVGYRYHHMSNANITTRNPGTDSHMLDVRFSWLR